MVVMVIYVPDHVRLVALVLVLQGRCVIVPNVPKDCFVMAGWAIVLPPGNLVCCVIRVQKTKPKGMMESPGFIPAAVMIPQSISLMLQRHAARIAMIVLMLLENVLFLVL